MSILTEFLKLFKYTQEDKNNNGTFNIETALNENWDKVEANAKAVSLALEQKADKSALEITKTLDTGYISLSSAGWYRVAKLTGNSSGVIKINTIFAVGGDRSVLAGYSIAHLKANVTILSVCGNYGSIIDKIRITQDKTNIGDYYIEIYYSMAVSNPINVVIDNSSINGFKGISIPLTLVSDSPTVLKEVAIADSISGNVATTDKIDISLLNGWIVDAGSNPVLTKNGNHISIIGSIKNGINTLLFNIPNYRPLVGMTTYADVLFINGTKERIELLIPSNGDAQFRYGSDAARVINGNTVVNFNIQYDI